MQLVVASRNGQLIRLGDVADGQGRHRGAAHRGASTTGARRSASTSRSRRATARPRSASACARRSTRSSKTLPPGVDARRRARRRARASTNSVRNVEEALVEGALLTVLVVFLFLNSWRSTVITGLALPVSVLASFIAVWAFGFTLEHDVAARPVAGDRHPDRRRDRGAREHRAPRRDGQGPLHGAREGTDEIGLAVAATTFSIVVVFVPIAFMGGIAGQWFKPFALTIACSVLVSLFVSFSLDPMLSAYWPDPHIPMEQRIVAARACSARFNDWFDRQAERYKRVIGWALDHRFVDGGCWRWRRSSARWRCRRSGCVGGGFFPVLGRLRVHRSPSRRRPARTSSTRSSRPRKRRAWRARSPRCRYTYTTIGGRTGAVDEANVYVRLTPKATRDAAARTRSRPSVRKRAGAARRRRRHRSAAATSTNQKQIQLQLQGPDIDELQPARRAWSRTRCGRCPARSTSGCRRTARSPSSTSRSTAAWPARSASPSGRSRRRCGRRSPASTPATGSIRRGETRDVDGAARARVADERAATSQRCRCSSPGAGRPAA